MSLILLEIGKTGLILFSVFETLCGLSSIREKTKYTKRQHKENGSLKEN